MQNKKTTAQKISPVQNHVKFIQYMCKSTLSRMSAFCIGKGNGNHTYEEHNGRATEISVQLCKLDGDGED